MKIIEVFKSMLQKLVASLKRFPEAIILAATATVIMIFMNHFDFYSNNLDQVLRRVVMVLALGIPLSLTTKMFFEGRSSSKKSTKFLIYAVNGAFLVLYYFYLLPSDANLIAGTRYIALNLALYCTFTFMPYLAKRPGYEQYVVALMRQFLVTALYGVVLFLGLTAIVFTIDQLLFNLSNKLYLDLWLIVVGIFAPAFFLSDVPDFG